MKNLENWEIEYYRRKVQEDRQEISKNVKRLAEIRKEAELYSKLSWIPLALSAASVIISIAILLSRL